MPTRQIPLVGEEGLSTDNDHPGANADYRYYLNGYFEKTNSLDESRTFSFTKRPGLSRYDSTSTFTSGHKIQGFMSSIDRTTQIVYTNNGTNANTTWLVTNGVPASKGTAPAVAGNWTYTGPVALTALDGISYGANVYYAATDFTKGAVINSTGVWTEITDAGFTGLNKCTNLIGLNGYLFIGTTNNRIYNSDLNAATTWTSTSFLSAVQEVPGRLLWLSKIRNFLVVFKDNSLEFFEDVGAPTPGSPLEARKSLAVKIGLLHRNTIQEVSDGIIFAGTTVTGMSKIYKISYQDLSIRPVSNRYIEQMLPRLQIATTTSDYSVDATASAHFRGQSQAFYFQGKEFYTINIPDISGGDNITQVYDNELGIWTSWATSLGTAGTTDTYGFVPSQAQEALIGTVTITVWADNSSSVARLLTSDPTQPVWGDRMIDSATVNYFPFGWTSDQMDFGNRKRKFCDSVEIHYTGDSSATPSNSASTTLTLRYRDTDYNMTSGYTVSRSLYYDPGGGVRCIARRLGSFRKRSFSILLNAVTPMKLWAVEINYNQGETDQEG